MTGDDRPQQQNVNGCFQGGLYCGGSAAMVEKALGVEGDDILYVG